MSAGGRIKMGKGDLPSEKKNYGCQGPAGGKVGQTEELNIHRGGEDRNDQE